MIVSGYQTNNNLIKSVKLISSNSGFNSKLITRGVLSLFAVIICHLTLVTSSKTKGSCEIKENRTKNKETESVPEVSGRTELASGYQATLLEGRIMGKCMGSGASRSMNLPNALISTGHFFLGLIGKMVTLLYVLLAGLLQVLNKTLHTNS